MQFIVTSTIFAIISLLICNTIAITISQGIEIQNEQDNCLKQKDCLSCTQNNECSLWYCTLPNAETTDQMVCRNSLDISPLSGCKGTWNKLQSPDNCQSIKSERNSDGLVKNKPSVSYTKALNNEDCAGYKDCESCYNPDAKCAFWWCDDNNYWTGDMSCQDPKDRKPKTSCSGKWSKLEKPNNCSDVHRKNSTTTTTPFIKGKVYLGDSIANNDKVDLKTEELQNKKLFKTYDTSRVNERCNEYKSCESCYNPDAKCAFWWCHQNDVWTGDMVCQDPKDTKPKTPCSGKWSKLEKPDKCSDIHTNSTTTTTPAPETTTNKNTTTTIKPTTTTTVPITSNPPAHDQGENKLTGWTITGITISSVLVIAILIGISYKKVMKIYRARNPYRTLND